MASRKTPLIYIATNYQIFFDIATTRQNRVAPATQYAQHIIQKFRQRSGVELTDFWGCIVYRPIYMASRKTLPLLILPRTIRILRYCHKLWQNCVAVATQHAQHNIELRQEAGSKTTDFLGVQCIGLYIWPLERFPLIYIHGSNILRYCH